MPAPDLLAAAFPGWPHTSAAPLSLIPLDTSPGDDTAPLLHIGGQTDAQMVREDRWRDACS
jgi:hypothetical protein